MANYEEVKVKLTNNQLKKLEPVAKYKTTIFCFTSNNKTKN